MRRCQALENGVLMRGKVMLEEPLLQFFAYEHLPLELQTISKPFGELAQAMMQRLPAASGERSEMLRKLLEAKDCAVRARLFK